MGPFPINEGNFKPNMCLGVAWGCWGLLHTYYNKAFSMHLASSYRRLFLVTSRFSLLRPAAQDISHFLAAERTR